MNDEDEFSSLVGDVKPHKHSTRVVIKEDKDKQHPGMEYRRQGAQTEQELARDSLSDTEIPMLEPLSMLNFHRPGIQHGVLRNLRLGKYPMDARLDLHRMTREQARAAVYQFVQDCIRHDVRSALITHGKGEGRETPALLKSCVAHWLPQIKEVLAFHTAQKQHGGYGATYLLLKKSDKKREETREKLR